MKFSLRHQSSGKIYVVLATIGQLMARAFMRKVYLHNRKAIPSDKPVLLAANHPTAFIDPCLLGIFTDPPLYNMTRGDIFQKPFFRKLLEGLNMFPVFRVRDGFNTRDRNDEVFEFCYQKLVEKRVVTIYVEGEHHLDRQVKPIKKGILRIAFDSYARTPMDELQIIPATCSYTYGDRPRDEVILNFGTPIYIRDYWDEYTIDPARAMNRLSRDILHGLKQISIYVEDPADEPLAEQLLTLNRAEDGAPLVPIVEFGNKRFLAEKHVCDFINSASGEQKNQLKENAGLFFNGLESAGLQADGLLHPEWGSPLRALLFLVGALPFLVGYISSFPIIRLAQVVTARVAKKREFRSSVHLGVAYLTSLVYYPLLLLIGVLTWNPIWIALTLSLPLLGWFSMFYRENWSRWLAARKAAAHPERDRLLQLKSRLALTNPPEAQSPGQTG